MRIALFALCLCGSALAADDYASAKAALDETRERAFEPGARARVYPAVERVAKSKDPRAVGALAAYIVFTLEGEAKTTKKMLRIQRRGADAHRRMGAIDKEIKHLNIRLKAGASEVGPRIEKLKAERGRQQAVFDQVRSDTDALGRAIGFGRELREKLAELSASVIASLERESQVAALKKLRERLDPKSEKQALLLVRILRGSRCKAAVPHLVDVIEYPTITSPVVRQASLALAGYGTKKAVDTLIALWAADEKRAGEHARYALSVAAKRPIKDLAEARAWSSSLEK